ncbi:hypothetical protein KY290_008660 [Solanum tuberosum]|uniref:HIG1 domain-containing protein n=1 Tax=Solanum tuberosum TaxID=4113 RepID=A0ABQ7W968_SOLTU|nr:hypothetical protein KY290_008660 [Solanum tuberosum]
MLKETKAEKTLNLRNTPMLKFFSAFLTAGVLTAGLISFKRGNSQLGQQLMRARVLVQGGTVALMVGSAYYYGDNFKRAG